MKDVSVNSQTIERQSTADLPSAVLTPQKNGVRPWLFLFNLGLLALLIPDATPLPIRVVGALGAASTLWYLYQSQQRSQSSTLLWFQQALQALRHRRKLNTSEDVATLPGLERVQHELAQLADYIEQKLPPEGGTAPLVPVHLEKNELEAIIHCMDDGLIIYDTDMNVILLNPALAQMLIPSNPAATGRLIQNPDDKLLFERGTDPDRMKEIHRAMIEAPELPRCDVVELQSPGQFLKRYASPLYNRFHQQIGHVIIYHDITKEVTTERMRSEFITNASHELRTPVTSIKLLLESLHAGAKDDVRVRDEFLNNLMREADRLHILVNDLLDLARLEAHEKLRMAEIDIRKVVHESIMTVSPLAQKKGIAIKENIESELSEMVADQLRLGQVIVNLVNNAVKFTPNGGEVRVIVRRVNQHQIEFKIQDTGIGIPAEDLPYIFDRFYRVEQNRQRRQNSGGSGLGLTICKQVVELHGGKISASSSNKGTAFTFTIPQRQPLALAS